MLDLNQMRAEFSKYLVEHTHTRWGLDAALMHVCRLAFEAGLREGARPKPPSPAVMQKPDEGRKDRYADVD